jgi:hypothetical protein
MIVLDSAANTETQAKAIALASGTDDVSVLSQLTDKTLRAATSSQAPGGTSNDDSSVESGQTSRSKTQAAVKEALKEVSLEHNKAMEEQRAKFQCELEELRRSLERNYTPHEISTTNTIPPSHDSIPNNPSREPSLSAHRVQETALDDSSPQEANMDIDSSDDDLAMTVAPQSGRKTGNNGTASKSPQPKRPKRSKSRTLRGRGGSKSHPDDHNE